MNEEVTELKRNNKGTIKAIKVSDLFILFKPLIPTPLPGTISKEQVERNFGR